MKIETRTLKPAEIELLEKDIVKFPDLGFISKKRWKLFKKIYVTTIKGEFVGICGVIPLKTFLKIGPVVILEKYQGNGYGKSLLNYVVTKNSKSKLYIGSSNPRIVSIVEKLHFKRESSFWKLPLEIKKYLVQYFLLRLNFRFLLDSLRKRVFVGRGKYYFFLRGS